jgi:hypothetical protein
MDPDPHSYFIPAKFMRIRDNVYISNSNEEKKNWERQENRHQGPGVDPEQY